MRMIFHEAPPSPVRLCRSLDVEDFARKYRDRKHVAPRERKQPHELLQQLAFFVLPAMVATVNHVHHVT